MLSTDAFNYVNVLDKAADASWSRENILTNNIANVNTLGFLCFVFFFVFF